MRYRCATDTLRQKQAGIVKFSGGCSVGGGGRSSVSEVWDNHWDGMVKGERTKWLSKFGKGKNRKK